MPGELLGIISDAQAAIASFPSSADPALTALARLLLRTEAIASSKIEGMQVATRELARAEAKLGLGVRVGPESRAILAAVEAMGFAIDQATDDPMATAAGLREIHRLMMRSAPGWTQPGQIRGIQNWIGGNDYNPCGADFVPPPPETVPGLLADLATACADETLPAIIQCALVHAQFETIHPFNDGNGRVGRALIHVLLRRRGLVQSFVPPVSLVLSRKRGEYISALVQFRTGDAVPWMSLFATSVAQSVAVSKRYMEDIIDLRNQWRYRLESGPRRPRADSVVWTLLELLPAHPVITGPAAVAGTGRSKPQVNRAIEQLVDAGVLSQVTTGTRNRSWEAAGLLDLIERLETGL